ncbi:Na(+) H(+) antiporter subunit E [plant metagenome]|uniref:Na(+) H(+) antiporter subunit E n=2 Tax=root TaxID=1 RepID=A0A1C3K4D6_9BURK|nr:Na+/H+ antiporter subunit E [Orrella dioscoreae]SBT26237.1 Na(+) H(+) antiporter subunit E [Orrella dioscoreae]SOE51064.1 Na(+) H(+) antiporter subunit E [Orrella dioscoreae]
MTQAPSLPRRLRACLVLCVVFLRELLLSSWSVAAAAFARQPRLAPAVIAMPLRLQSDLAIATLANLVSLTPGTTSLHVSEDRATLYMHCLNAETPEQVIEGIRRAFEDPLLEIEG